MAKGFPIYSDLIIKLDPKNVNMVQAQLKQTLSSGSMSIDIAKPIGLREYEDALKRVRRESTGLIGDMQSLGERSTRVFARFSAYLLASGGILASISLMKDAIGQALKFNSELIRIKQVSGDSNAAIGKLADEVGRLSKNLGVSSSELIKSAVTLKQAGLSVRDTTKALETLAQAELAPNFDSMAKTTEGLIAIYQQFGKNIDKVKTQLGSLNAVAGEFAVEASDLITVVQKAGGAAASSGASLEQLLGLFTSVRATTRESADSIATGLRTIFGRLQRPETIKFLDELGIKMRYTADEAKAAGKNAGDFVGPFEAILRISAATANMGTGSTLFSNLVEQIGGLRQISRVVPLIKESSLAVEAWNVALAGQNSLYINSLQKQDDYLIKLKKIQEMFLEMGRNLVTSKGFENLVAVLGSMAKAAIQLTDALGPLLPYLTQLLVLNTAMGAVRSVGGGILTSLGLRDAKSQKKMATGGIVPGSGSGDKVPALLEPGEAVIPVKSVQKYSSIIPELIKGNLPRFSDGYMPSITPVGNIPQSRIDRVERLYKNITDRQPLDRRAYGVEKIFIHDDDYLGHTANYSASKKIINLYPDAFTSNKRKSFKHILGHELAHGIDNTIPDIIRKESGNFGLFKSHILDIGRLSSEVSEDGSYKIRGRGKSIFKFNGDDDMVYPEFASHRALISSRFSKDSYQKLSLKDDELSKYIKRTNSYSNRLFGLPIFDEYGRENKDFIKYFGDNYAKLPYEHYRFIRGVQGGSRYLRSTNELFARTVGEKFLSRGKGILGILERLGISNETLGKHNLLKMATGGIVPGSGSGDKTPALLEPGEAVIPKNQVNRFPSFVKQLISGGVKGFADGGVIGFDDNYYAELRRREILKKQKEGIFTPSSGIYRFQNESTLDYIGPDGMPKSANRGKAESKTKKTFRSSSGRFESIFNIDEDDSFSRDATRREEIQRRYAEDKIRTEETLRIQKDAEIAARKRREIAEKKEMERTVLSPYRKKALSQKPSPDIFSFASNPPPPPPPPKPDIYRQYSPNEWGVLSNRGIGNQSQSGINPMYGISEDRNARQFVENQKRLEKLLAAEVQAKAYMKTGEVPTNASRRVQEYILNPETSKQKIKNLQIAQGMISAGGVGPMKMQQPGSFRMSLPVIGMDGRYSTEEEYNLLASASARKQGGLTIQDINSSAALYNAGGNKSIPYDQLNQSKVPFTPGGIGGNQNYVPPKGPFGFGRGGGSGSGGGGSGSGGGGGGGSSGDSNDISLARAAKDFRREKIYGGLSSLVGIGVPLALGAGAAFQKDEETQSRLGAASVGAGIGGQLGSLGGPLGTIVGTAIGGIVGWFVSGADAVKDAAKKLQAKKLDESVEKLNLALEDLSEGRGSIGKLAESLSEVRQNAFKNAKENLKPGENLFQKSQDEFQKLAGINLAKYQKEINEQLKKQAQAGQGPLLQGEFNEVAKSIVQIRQRKGERFTMQDYEKQLKTTYDAFAADKTRKDADIRFVQQIDASVHSAKSFADAVQKAADSAAEMDKNISILSSGGYSTPSLRLGEYGGINQKNLSSLSSFGGGMFSGLTSQVSSVNQVSKYLPEVLSRIIKPGEGSNTDTSISGAFEEAFNNIAKQTGEKFDKKVLSVLSNKLESMKTEDLFENFKKAPEQFADEMIKSFEPALKALESIGKNLEARDEAYQRGLSQLKEMNNKRNELFAQRNSINLGLADISDEMFNNRLGIKQNPRFSNARDAFVSEQQRLAPGLDVNTIGDAIAKEKANLRVLQEKASEEARAANGSKVFADKVLESENKLNNFNKALVGLTNRSEELSRLQARRSTLESRIDARIQLNKAFYSSDRQGLLQMNRDFGAAKALTTFGPDKIRQNFGIDFGADVYKRGMAALEGPLANVVLERRKVKGEDGKTRVVEMTGSMLANEMNAGKGGGEKEEIAKILKEMQKISSEGGIAVDIMLNDLKNSEMELYKKLQENNNSFTENLNRLIDELTNNARVAETAKDRTRLNEIEPQLKAADELQKSGLNQDAIRKNAAQIRQAKAAQNEFDNVSANAENNAASAEFYIKQNLGKKSIDSIAAGTAQFGYTPDEQRKIALALEGMTKFQGDNSPEVKRLQRERDKEAYATVTNRESPDFGRRIADPVKLAEYNKKIEEERKKQAEITPDFSARLRELQIETAERNKLDKERRVAPGLLPATRLSDNALKFAESQGESQKLQKENLDLQRRINENDNRIKQFEAAKANKAVQQQQQAQPQFPAEAPNIPLSVPGPSRFMPRKNDRPLGPELGTNFDKTFTDFNANFGKQVEALAAIPKVIEMNVKQTVEVIVNGAGALAMLEPTMKKVADAAVIKGIETIGGQLRAANIKINYDPSADGGAA